MDIFRILSFSPIPMGFVPCDARVLAGLPDSTLDLFMQSREAITLHDHEGQQYF